jgi:amino acid transporter
MRLKRTIIFGTVFWVLFLVSVALGGRYRWISTAWVIACIAFIIITSISSITEILRNRNTSGEYIYYRGAPRWMRWFLQDEVEYAKDLEKRTKSRLQ